MARDASFFEQGFVHFLGTVRIVPDLMIIVLGVLPLAYFLFTTYPRLKARTIREGESVWERLGVKLQLSEVGRRLSTPDLVPLPQVKQSGSRVLATESERPVPAAHALLPEKGSVSSAEGTPHL